MTTRKKPQLPHITERKMASMRMEFQVICLAVLSFWLASSWMLNSILSPDLVPHSNFHRMAQAEFNSRSTLAAASPDKNDLPNRTIVLTGIVRTLGEIRNSTWQLLSQLSCRYHVTIHITTADQISDHDHPAAQHSWCAPFWLESQDDLLANQTLSTNRVLRIAQIRDAQRRRLQTLVVPFSSTRQWLEQSVVIVVDLDLWKLPSADQIMGRLRTLFWSDVDDSDNDSSRHVDVVCGAGLWLDHPYRKKDETLQFYYDNFALVFEDGTFPFYKRGRKVPKYFAGENTSLVPVPIEHWDPTSNATTQFTLMRHIQALAQQDPRGLAPVRSCFGGLALYRLSIFFHCRYTLTKEQRQESQTYQWTKQKKRDKQKHDAWLENLPDHSSSIMRFANHKDNWPCEHVVLHECLHQQQQPKTAPRVAIDPTLLTFWRKNPENDNDNKLPKSLPVKLKKQLLRLIQKKKGGDSRNIQIYRHGKTAKVVLVKPKAMKNRQM